MASRIVLSSGIPHPATTAKIEALFKTVRVPGGVAP